MIVIRKIKLKLIKLFTAMVLFMKLMKKSKAV